MSGCATTTPPPSAGVDPLVRELRAQGGRDLREAFAAAFCHRLVDAPPADGPVACRELLRLPAPNGLAVAAPAPAPAEAYRILLVSGLFAGCIGDASVPMADIEATLRSAGFPTQRLTVAGRGGAAANAAALARQVEALPDDGRALIAVAYSKGLVDVLEMQVHQPAAARRLTAIISLAGAAGGTPLASSYADAYGRWLAHLPLPGCDAGDGQELLDLAPARRQAWWQQHGADVAVPVYALVAAPSDARISPLLELTHRELARTDPDNDGQLTWRDQLAPGAALLAVVDADHWAIANGLSSSLPLFAVLFRDQHVPRAQLVHAALDVVHATLPANRAAVAGPMSSRDWQVDGQAQAGAAAGAGAPVCTPVSALNGAINGAPNGAPNRAAVRGSRLG
jgi:hypothetical protein